MTEIEYKRKIEKELIKEFLDKFYEKVGYRPIVITDTLTDESGPPMTLDDLASVFIPYLPEINKVTYGLKSKSRYRPLVELRCIFCYLGKAMGYTLISLGRYLNRDHTTIMHNINTFNDLNATNDLFKIKYLKIVSSIKDRYESSIMDNIDQTQNKSKSDILFGLLQREDTTIE